MTSETANTPDRRALLQRALTALDKMEGRLRASEAARREPIAVIGLGCRFPGGADTPESYWDLLREGVDAVGEVPRDRWDVDEFYDPDPAAPGKTSTRRGGFLDRVDEFDARHFGISPREAETLDPQHRLLLEVSWEALERAARRPDRLKGSATGVFVGITTSDYAQLIRAAGGFPDVYAASGNALNAAAGRLAYFYGFQGPCMAVDTACSSSLVATHLACQSLRNGDCDMALAAGVNVMLLPDPFILFSKWGMLAPDGRCKTFDAAADGFVRGEGCGAVVLRRLSDALADGDAIMGVIRGSAVNQDGASSGLSVPNGPAQEAVIRRALEAAQLGPADVHYVEAHGTGTPLGDPIEIEALGAVYGRDRGEAGPLLVGSVKTNFGHLESAAGIAGLIKTILSLKHGEVPPHLHLTQLNPRVEWGELALDVPTRRTPWPGGAEPRRAGVSSFGFSGTNAHVILESPPEHQPAQTDTPPTERFQRKRFWIPGWTPGQLTAARGGANAEEPEAHPLLGRRLRSPLREVQYEQLVRANRPGWLRDHRIYGRSIFPAAAFIEMGLAAARRETGKPRVAISDGAWREALPLGDEARRVQLALCPDAKTFRIFSQAASGNDEAWTLHADGKWSAIETPTGLPAEAFSAQEGEPQVSLEDLRNACPDEMEPEAFYAALREQGLEYGPAFRGLREIFAGENRAFGRAALSDGVDAGEYAIHPAVLDSCFHLLGAAMEKSARGDGVYLPVGFERCEFFRAPGKEVFCAVRIEPASPADRVVRGHLELFDAQGSAIVRIAGLRIRRVGREAFERAVRPPASDDFYEIDWEGLPDAQSKSDRADGLWIVCDFYDAGGGEVQALLEARGARAYCVRSGKDIEVGEGRVCAIYPDRSADYEALFERIASENETPLRGLIYLGRLGSDDARFCAEDVQTHACRLLETVKAATFRWPGAAIRFTAATRGAECVGAESAPEGDSIAWGEAAWHGLLRTAALELPRCRFRSVDLDPAKSAAVQLEALLRECEAEDDEDRIALRGERRYGARLSRFAPKAAAGFSCDPNQTYLITGGLGGLGLGVAQRLAERGARRLALMSRSGANEDAASAVERLREAGVEVAIEKGDVSHEDDVRHVMERIAQSGHPLGGVIHAAGVLDDAVFPHQNRRRFERAMAPKVRGAWHLHKAVGKMDLQFFVLFSSASATFGSPGQANYAAANAFMDALARERRRRGLPAISIAWGPWAEVGMAARTNAARAPGLRSIAVDEGLAAAERALASDAAHCVFMPVDWLRFARQPEIPYRAFLSRVLPASSGPSETSGAQTEAENLSERLRTAAPDERRRLIERRLVDHAERVFKIERADFDPAQSFHELGIDSLMALELKNAVERDFGVALPIEIYLDQASVAELTRQFANKFETASASASDAAPDDLAGLASERPDRVLAQMDRLSEEQIDALLAQLKSEEEQ